MGFVEILYEKVGRVARVTLNRPQQQNAQTAQMRSELDHAFASAVADDEIRVIVLAAAGKHFSSGHDIASMGAEEALSSRAVLAALDPWDQNVQSALRWRDLPKPTVAEVQGFCIYGGWTLASTMDLIVAADTALFLPGAIQYFSAPWDIGLRRAKQLLLESRFMTAEEALASGFVTRIAKADQLDQVTMEIAQSIAESDPLLLYLSKRAVNQAQDAMGFRQALEAAFEYDIMLQLAGPHRPFEGDKPRLPPVDQALRKLRGGPTKGPR